MQRASVAASLLFVALFSSGARAEEVSVSMALSEPRVALGETVILQIRVVVQGAEVDDVTLPDLSAFQVLRREESRPLHFSFGVGSRAQMIQSSAAYTFVLRPVRTGRLTIGPAKARVQGRYHSSSAVTLVVTDQSGGQGTALPRAPGAPHDTESPTLERAEPPSRSKDMVDASHFDERAFIRAVADKGSPYVGEQVTVTQYLYVREPLRSPPTATQEPSASGFWVHDLLPPSRSLDGFDQVVGGLPFRAYVLRRFAAFPLEAGSLTVGRMAVTVELGSVFFGTVTALAREGLPLAVRARPLPTNGKPRGLVHVGALQVSSNLDPFQLKTGEAATYRLTLSGTGNLRALRPDFPQIKGVRVLAPQIRDDVQAPSDGVGGTRVIEWLLVPEVAGEHTIPAIGMASFDTRTATYASVSTRPATLIAVGDVASPTTTEPREEAKDGDGRRDSLPRTSANIHAQSALLRTRLPWVHAVWFWLLTAAMPAAYGVFEGVLFFQRRSKASVQRPDASAVRKRLKARFAAASQLARSGDVASAAREAQGALEAALELLLGRSVHGLSHGELRHLLLAKATPPQTVTRLIETLESFERARFGSLASGREALSETVRTASVLGDELLTSSTPPEGNT